MKDKLALANLKKKLKKDKGAKIPSGELGISAKIPSGKISSSVEDVPSSALKEVAKEAGGALGSSVKVPKMTEMYDTYEPKTGYGQSKKKKKEIEGLKGKMEEKGLKFMSPKEIMKKMRKIEGK